MVRTALRPQLAPLVSAQQVVVPRVVVLQLPARSQLRPLPGDWFHPAPRR